MLLAFTRLASPREVVLARSLVRKARLPAAVSGNEPALLPEIENGVLFLFLFHFVGKQDDDDVPGRSSTRVCKPPGGGSSLSLS